MAVTYEEALASVLPIIRTQDVHRVSLANVAGEILAEDVLADRNIPPFPRAAMDGYAVIWTGRETGTTYRVVGTVNPGSEWQGDAAASDCVGIMTGASVPPPFDTVIQVELSEAAPGGCVRFTGSVKRGEHIAKEGEDVRKGALLIPSGTLVSPHHVAILSSAGMWEVPAYKRPSVAVIATGSELLEPWESARGAMIRNTNSHFLLSALKELGFHDVRYLGIVPDDRDRIVAKIREGLDCDFLLLSGGVSVGEVDIVPDCLKECGVRKILHKVAVKPGKPIFAGESAGGGIVIGLPGNPVAVMVHFHMFIRPLLLKASGAAEYLPKPIHLPLSADAFNKSGGKKFTIARLESRDGKTHVVEIPSHGSGDYVSAGRADGVFEIPLGTVRLPAGHIVRFYPIWGNFLSDGNQ
ncbi:MAG: molybdopterin molybdotransferase MoeA [Deltaproteobacteria bacterium]|nr:molybdopterin molybdotransferase MoeA [Deltaproteobacteria bacterium]